MTKCPCGRPFVTGFSYVEHAFRVHGTDDVARKVPKIKHEGKYEVPYLTKGEGGGVSGSDCDDCTDNTDPVNLPLHPGCNCEPEGGWESYINKIADEKPDNWTKKQWATHIEDLREAHDVPAPKED